MRVFPSRRGLVASSFLIASAIASTPAFAQQTCSVDSGSGGSASGADSLACGQGAQATGGSSTAFGRAAYAIGNASTAVGALAGPGSATFGAISVGYLSNAVQGFAGDYSIAIGSSGNSSVIGAYSQGTGSIAIGSGTNTGGIAARAQGGFAIALGSDSSASGNRAVALGVGAIATGGGSIAIGSGSVATDANIVSFGSAGNERRLTNVAAGAVTSTSTDAVNGAQLNSVSIMAQEAFLGAANARTAANAAQATANTAVANAAAAQATADNALARTTFVAAVGTGPAASATGANAIAIGSGSTATAAGSVAIGTGATATRSGQVALGTSGSTYTLAGIGSTASAAAQAGALRIVTTDLAGNLATTNLDINLLAGLGGRVSTLETAVEGLDARVRQVNKRAAGGIAATAALGGTMVVPDSSVSLNFNLASYRGEQGFSTSVVARATPRVYVSAGVAGSTVKGSTVGRAGLAIGF